MGLKDDPPTAARLTTLLQAVAPGASLVAVHALDGNFSNSTHRVEAVVADGAALEIVTRRYAVYGDYDRGEKARREYQALQLLRQHGCAVPEPLYLDDAGALLGGPGIVTRYVPGRLLLGPPYPERWADELAETLAAIHAVPLRGEDTRFLLNANDEVLWFLGAPDQRNQAPAYIAAHPLGGALWRAVVDYLPRLVAAPPALVHVDYWLGNILWSDGRIAAVVDWEEAAQGDPGIDVAYLRMDLTLSGMAAAADQFLATYESVTGAAVANLGLWELAAAVRPLFRPDGWISESPAKERFAAYVEAALQRIAGPA